MQIPLKGGFYRARSLIANAQRCTNLYPERNPEDAEAPVTLYPTPGLVARGVVPAPGPWRGLYTASNNNLYGVLGNFIYYIDQNANAVQLGPLLDPRLTPVGMTDNGQQLVVVDGSPQGYTVALATNTYAQIGDANFLGATRADYLDTFLLFNQPGTRNWYSSLSNQVVFDATYLVAKSGAPDLLSTLIVMHRELWLLGQKTSELWSNNGGATFPFGIMSGIFIEHGCVAPYSVAKHGLQIFWLGLDKDGVNTVFSGTNYAAKKISTPAIAAEFSKYALVSDAIGMTYKQQDHVFYVLVFPSADRTWVYDASEDLWHERASIDVNGVEHRIRPNAMAFAYGKTWAGDFNNGQLYNLDTETFTDAGMPIVRRRSLPHLVQDGKRVTYDALRADMDCGNFNPADFVGSPWGGGFSPGFGPPAVLQLDNVYLRWSDDRGKTFGNPVGQRLGNTGQYLTQPQWRQLGMARDRVFEFLWATPAFSALQGAWIDVTPAGT
jgi:hypothetical protein